MERMEEGGLTDKMWVIPQDAAGVRRRESP